jgi:hypothetical protein
VKSVVRVGPQNDPKIADPDLADQEWIENTDPSQQRSVPILAGARFYEPTASGVPGPALAPRPPESPQTGQQRLTSAKADLAELELAKAAGLLVVARDVKQRLVAEFTECKTKLLAIPSRARQQLPHLTNADVAALEKLVREALENLAAS